MSVYHILSQYGLTGIDNGFQVFLGNVMLPSIILYVMIKSF